MAQTQPGEVKAMLPAAPPQPPSRSTRSSPTSIASSCPASPLAAPAVLRLLPVERAAVERARRLRQHRPRRARPDLAGQPRAHRGRGSRHRLDAPDGRPVGAWSGVIQDTASTSTLVALLCARERATDFSLSRGGLQAEERRSSSTSRRRATARSRRRRCSPASAATTCASSARRRYAMRPDALERLIATDLARGRRPCAVVATTGTTTSTALDPIEAIARVARAHGMWLHVDAAMAGSAMILPECRWMWDGVEHADSLIVNPHKWLGAAFDCSLYFVRDPEHLVRVMSTNPELPANRRRRPGEELPRLGHPARPPLPRAQAVVPDPRAGRRGLQARLRPGGGGGRGGPRGGRARAGRRRWGGRSRPRGGGPKPTPGGGGEGTHRGGWTPAMLDGRWIVRVSIGAELTEREHVSSCGS